LTPRPTQVVTNTKEEEDVDISTLSREEKQELAAQLAADPEVKFKPPRASWRTYVRTRMRRAHEALDEAIAQGRGAGAMSWVIELEKLNADIERLGVAWRLKELGNEVAKRTGEPIDSWPYDTAA
jgi:hypothetical protein